MVDRLQIKIIKTLQLLLITLGLITPFAYLMGLFYYQAYINSYGVSIDNFPLSIPDTYVYAYIAVGGVINDAIQWLIGLMKNEWLYLGFITFVLFVYGLVKLVKNKDQSLLQKLHSRVKSTINRFHYKNSDLSKSIYVVGVPTYYLAIAIYIFCVIFVFWWGILIVAKDQGEKISKSRIAEFKTQGCIFDKKTHWNNCVLVLDESGEVIHQGLLVAQNKEQIAIFKKDGSYLIKLKDDHIVRKEFN
ncbi:MAG: hypothetical protein V4552_01760 [Pseudomonadota bacterium]